jgi:endonuclease YncB( thermonuclease family)
MHIFILFFTMVLTPPLMGSSSQAAPLRTVTGTVTKVSDGNMIHIIVAPEQTHLQVRLFGIDAPQAIKTYQRNKRTNRPGQPYGQESKKALSRKIMGKLIRLDFMDIDQHKRMMGMIWLGNRNINLEMIREGYAGADTEYLKEPYRSQFLSAQSEARSARKGIWNLPES